MDSLRREMKAPFDFVSTHMYPTDPQLGHGARWNPSGLTEHVKAARASVPDKPFYLTECESRFLKLLLLLLRRLCCCATLTKSDNAADNVGCCIGYAGHDTSASAAFAFRTIPALDGVVDILSWWTFTECVRHTCIRSPGSTVPLCVRLAPAPETHH